MALKEIPFILSENQTARLTDQISLSENGNLIKHIATRIRCHGQAFLGTLHLAFNGLGSACLLNSQMRYHEWGGS